MSIAANVAVLLAALGPPAAPVNRTAPPIVINISAASNVSASLIRLAQSEADAIFRSAGVSFIWRQGQDRPPSLHVVFGNDGGPKRDTKTPIGWIRFEDGAPTREIYLSYANAERFLADSREVVGNLQNKTIAEREMLLGRLMGRALAHELGHCLLATKEHTRNGLLKGARSAQEFFSQNPSAFAIGPAERRQLVARLSKESDLARRDP